MKKSLLLILASLFAVFALTGCAEDSKNDTPAPTPPPADLAGTYNVTFFGSQVINPRDVSVPSFEGTLSAFYISNNCVQAAELYPDIVNQNGQNSCTTDTQSTLLDSAVVIDIVNNQMNITSRMQMEGGAVEYSETDKYQYTVYNPATSLSGMGVKGWNYDVTNSSPSASSTDFPESPFKVTTLSDDSVRIDMTLVGKKINAFGLTATVDAKNTIILTKVSNDTTALENAIQAVFPTPAN